LRENMKRNRLLVAVASALLVAAVLPASISADVNAPITGAIFTTGNPPDCTPVNMNTQYSSKEDVYLNGGPLGGTNFVAGTYWVQVTSPGGTVLGESTSATFAVGSDGKSVKGCDQLWSLVKSASYTFATEGYDDTINPGGVYIVAVCGDSSFAPRVCKYDAFKVEGGGNEQDTDTLVAKKYYDADGSGLYTAGDTWLSGWQVTLKTNTDVAIGTAFTEASWSLDVGTYKVTESMPNEAGWINSDPGDGTFTKSGTVAADATTTLIFGNYCRFQGVGARTIGYWKTHQAATTELLPITTLYSPVTVSSWNDAYGILNGASSKDANVMLKAQLLGALLNVKADPTLGTAYVAGTGMTVNQIISGAQAFLVTNGALNLTKGSATRDTAIYWKNLLDGINNSNEGTGSFVINPTACTYTFGS